MSIGRPALLVVDDRAENRTTLRALLEEGGDHEIVLAASGEEALAALLRHDVAIILMDVAMPGLSGHALAESLLALRRDLPIVLLSGYLKPEDARFAAELGIRHLMLKPSTVEEMARTLAPVIDELVA